MVGKEVDDERVRAGSEVGSNIAGGEAGRGGTSREGEDGREPTRLRASSESPSYLLSFVFLRLLVVFASVVKGVVTSGGMLVEDLLNPNLI
jgi:hypothetical protein